MKTSNFLMLGAMGLLWYIRMVGFDAAAFLVSVQEDANKHLIENLEPLEEPANKWTQWLKRKQEQEDFLWEN